MATATAETWIVEFHHPYFGWLRYDNEFSSREAAEYWRQVNESGAYPTRARK